MRHRARRDELRERIVAECRNEAAVFVDGHRLVVDLPERRLRRLVVVHPEVHRLFVFAVACRRIVRPERGQLPAIDELREAARRRYPPRVERHVVIQPRQGARNRRAGSVEDNLAILGEVADERVVSCAARNRRLSRRAVRVDIRSLRSAIREECDRVKRVPTRIQRQILPARPRAGDRCAVRLEDHVSLIQLRPVSEEIAVLLGRHQNRFYRVALPGVDIAHCDAVGNERHDERHAHRLPMRVVCHVRSGIPGALDGGAVCVIDLRAARFFRKVAEEAVILPCRLRCIRSRIPLLRGYRIDDLTVRAERDIGKPQPMRKERHVLGVRPNAKGDTVEVRIVDFRSTRRFRKVAEEDIAASAR